MPIRILIADDQRLFRQSLKYLLEQEGDMKVVGEVGDGQDAFTLAQESHPDIILMDVDMPKLDGVTATRLILERKPSIKVLMLSVHDEDERIIAAIHNGAIGYILKDADHKEFIRIIRGTFRGENVVSPFLANRIPKVMSQIDGPASHNKDAEAHSKISLLTERERETLGLVSEGKSNKEIADLLCISIETAKSHLQTIYRKLGVKSRTEAAILFLKEKPS
ncbi:MAG: response regulator transcription factor [Nitrospirae bacterium]|nr:response regulator transcription factor [Nitrospirota bacterium]